MRAKRSSAPLSGKREVNAGRVVGLEGAGREGELAPAAPPDRGDLGEEAEAHLAIRCRNLGEVAAAQDPDPYDVSRLRQGSILLVLEPQEPLVDRVTASDDVSQLVVGVVGETPDADPRVEAVELDVGPSALFVWRQAHDESLDPQGELTVLRGRTVAVVHDVPPFVSPTSIIPCRGSTKGVKLRNSAQSKHEKARSNAVGAC